MPLKNSNKVIIFGMHHTAEVAFYYLKNDSDYNPVAFTCDQQFCTAENFKNLPVIAFETLETQYPPSEYLLFLPINYKNVNKIREERYYQAKKKGYHFINYISPKALCNTTHIGENCFIFELNNIQPEVHIGNNVILWSGNYIAHHTIIEDHCFIASHAVISGGVTLGKNSFVGANATIRDNITIGKECIIGAGALVLNDIPDYSVVAAKATEIKETPSYQWRSAKK